MYIHVCILLQQIWCLIWSYEHIYIYNIPPSIYAWCNIHWGITELYAWFWHWVPSPSPLFCAGGSWNISLHHIYAYKWEKKIGRDIILSNQNQISYELWSIKYNIWENNIYEFRHFLICFFSFNIHVRVYVPDIRGVEILWLIEARRIRWTERRRVQVMVLWFACNQFLFLLFDLYIIIIIIIYIIVKSKTSTFLYT